MGTFTHPITLIAATGGRSETVEALVDTGSTFSSFPSSLLEHLGVRPHRTVRLLLADGRREECPLGSVTVEIDGLRETALCVFGTPDAPSIIGAHTLEALLLAADPVGKRLVPVDAFWV